MYKNYTNYNNCIINNNKLHTISHPQPHQNVQSAQQLHKNTNIYLTRLIYHTLYITNASYI